MISNLKIIGEINNSYSLKREIPELTRITKEKITGIIQEDNTGFYKYTNAYLKTTENINGYYDLMNLRGKSILTVIGASDQVFDAITRGAKKIDGFDISIYAIMFYYLKEAAIKTLDFDEYIEFFYVENKCFNYETFEKIKNHLNENSKDFWNSIFEHKALNMKELISKLIIGNQLSLYPSKKVAKIKLSRMSTYLNEFDYYTLKGEMYTTEVNIYLRDVKELDDIGEKYDYIILSNIYEYQKGEDRKKFKEAIERYKEKLNPSGMIIVGYKYCGLNIDGYEEYQTLEIPSTFNASGIVEAPKDSIMIVRK